MVRYAITVLLICSLASACRASEENDRLQSAHKHFSASCFNKCWEYIEKEDLNDEDKETMLALAFASYWHWTQRDDCRPMNLNIAYWQLGRVHNLVGKHSDAIAYGKKCLDLSEKEELGPFSIAYGHEVIAMALIGQKKEDQAKVHIDKAREHMAKIKDREELGLIQADLDKLEKQISEDNY